MLTTGDFADCPPQTRALAARYLAYDCPKLRMLAKLLHDEGAFVVDGEPNRFIVFCQWPLTLWVTELFIDALGIDYEVIRSSVAMEKRPLIAEWFNDPASTCRVLLTT
ncbi:hypothetical protein P170DRAFT_470179 [Aspergillus steynii IBT 23096]|uniref:Uncharacterized protein n=1 Tax=Aspergillus steynii IBT 23096 TaxID=1392250 RepID=A0A2I2GPD3_9EURO|nr:uncharacterized protein P170DRAFT_470179 [Aspergillus steynii IBT 23096]PLB54734.1 hypothetical protein P170DRAFT_470179 [Aspergillus steynii IBT 23096]